MAIANVGDSQNFAYVGGVQRFTAPMDGVYKLEAIGARGGVCANNGTNVNGLGGYGRGYVKLKKGEIIYVCVGGKGENGGGGYTNDTRAAGGYNGGGNGGIHREWFDVGGWHYGKGAGGGGATHFARVTGTLQSIGSAENVLLVAGGGGGEVMGNSNSTAIGSGGGASGTAGGNSAGGTQTSGYAFGKGQDGLYKYDGWSQQGNGGAGGGLYGGYANQYEDIPYSGAGGSGYIGGVPAFTEKGTTYAPDWITGYSGAAGNGSATVTLVAKGNLPIMVNGKAARIYVNGVEVQKLVVNMLKTIKEAVRKCFASTETRFRFRAAIQP